MVLLHCRCRTRTRGKGIRWCCWIWVMGVLLMGSDDTNSVLNEVRQRTSSNGPGGFDHDRPTAGGIAALRVYRRPGVPTADSCIPVFVVTLVPRVFRRLGRPPGRAPAGSSKGGAVPRSTCSGRVRSTSRDSSGPRERQPHRARAPASRPTSAGSGEDDAVRRNWGRAWRRDKGQSLRAGTAPSSAGDETYGAGSSPARTSSPPTKWGSGAWR